MVIEAGAQLINLSPNGTHINLQGNNASVTANGTADNRVRIEGNQSSIFFANATQSATINHADILARSGALMAINTTNNVITVNDSYLGNLIQTDSAYTSFEPAQAIIRVIAEANQVATGNTYNINRTDINTDDSGIGLDSWVADSNGGAGAANNTFNITDSTIDANYASIVVDGGTGNTFNLAGSSALTSTNSPTAVINSAGNYSLLWEGGYAGASNQTFTLNMRDTSSLNGGLSGLVFVGGAGMQAANMHDQSAANGNLQFGADADQFHISDMATAGNVDMGTGDDVASWNDASTIARFQGGDGSDRLTVGSSKYDGTQVLDGGDDVKTSDGFIDTLTLDGLTVNVPGANLRNWENIVVDGGTLSLTDGALPTSSDAGYGLIVRGGGTFDGQTVLALTGNMIVESDGTFDARGGGIGDYKIIGGSLSNAGIVTSQDDAVGDVITVDRNHQGGGTYLIDTNVDALTSDRLVVKGDVTGGTTTVDVNVLGTVGTYTGSGPGNGIEIVNVSATGNTDDDDFMLLGGPLTVGAFNYDLNRETNGIWYLQSVYLPQVPTYEAYGQSLLNMLTMPTMQQRIGNRWYWPQGSGPDDVAFTAGRVSEQSGIWARIEASHTNIDPSFTTTGTSFEQNQQRVQAGVDGLLKTWDDGSGLFVGLTGHYGTASTDVASVFGDGSINTTGYGVGGTLTWLGGKGAYVDLQGSATWFDSDLSADGVGRVISGNDGFGYALSAEAGHKFDLHQGWMLTPQAQLIYAKADFDSFVGPNMEAVSLDNADSLRLRLGLSADRDISWTGENGLQQRSRFYAIVNVIHEFNTGTTAIVSGTPVTSERDSWAGEIGLGFTRNLDDDKYSIYGEVKAVTGLNNFGDSYELGGTIGARIRF